MGVRDIKDHSSQKKDEKWGLSLHFNGADIIYGVDTSEEV
jgi:hypothetical protein